MSFNNQETLESLASRISTQIEADSLSLLKAFQSNDFLQSEMIDHGLGSIPVFVDLNQDGFISKVEISELKNIIDSLK